VELAKHALQREVFKHCILIEAKVCLWWLMALARISVGVFWAYGVPVTVVVLRMGMEAEVFCLTLFLCHVMQRYASPEDKQRRAAREH
jgi:hypothetical protein